MARRRQAGTGPFNWTMPDASVQVVFYPTGEVVTETPTALLIKWRDIGYPTPVYQWASVLLSESGLKIRWGAFAASAAAAVVPPLGPATAPNDVDVLTYDHEHQTGF